MRGEVRAGRREGAAGDGGARSVQGRARLQIGGRARAECTWNIQLMVMTLDVSKLSGWLNAAAPCRVERRAYDAGRGAGREGGSDSASGMHGEGPTEGWGAEHARSARRTCRTWL